MNIEQNLWKTWKSFEKVLKLLSQILVFKPLKHTNLSPSKYMLIRLFPQIDPTWSSEKNPSKSLEGIKSIIQKVAIMILLSNLNPSVIQIKHYNTGVISYSSQKNSRWRNRGNTFRGQSKCCRKYRRVQKSKATNSLKSQANDSFSRNERHFNSADAYGKFQPVFHMDRKCIS